MLIALQALQSSSSARSASLASPHLSSRKCTTHTVDNFSSYPYLYHLNQNATLNVTQEQAGSQLALPHRRVPTGVLSVKSADTQSSAFSFGRRYPLAQNWSKSKALTFWYYGHNTGKSIAVTLQGQQAVDPGPSGWQLAWSQEFDGPAGTPPDPAIWSHDMGDGSASGIPGWGNQELEYYTDSTDNAALDGAGNLVITARQATPQQNLTCYYGPCKYTSARLSTAGKLEFAYGRIEARMKLPAGSGLWPAFWMLGTNIGKVGWPKSGEVDIMENVGRQPRELYGTIHGPGYEGAGIGGTFSAPDDLSNAYHVYSVQWQPGSVSWAIDGNTYFTAAKKDVPTGNWVFDHPFFLLLNVAVGGAFGGPVADSTTFPQTLSVDYIRVYQAPDTAARFSASFTDSFSGWKHIALPFGAFVRSAQQPANAPDGPLDRKSIWGYTFDAPAGLSDGVLLANLQLASRAGGCGSGST